MTYHIYIYLLICTGARFRKMQNLKYEDININTNLIHITGTKIENANRTIALAKQDKKHIKTVLANRPTSFNGYVFNTDAKLISNSAVTKVLHRICLEESIGRYSLHSLRHTHYLYC